MGGKRRYSRRAADYIPAYDLDQQRSIIVQQLHAFREDGLRTAGVTPRSFRDGMARLSAAVSIVCTDGPAGRAGFTASAVCSVTDTPPTLLVCLNRNASVYSAFKENRVLCVNTLAAEQQELSRVFGGNTPSEERFAKAEWRRATTGSPVLVGASVSFDCQIVEMISRGTHDVLFCEIKNIETNIRSDALVYYARRYHRLA
jgi:flavin reductase